MGSSRQENMENLLLEFEDVFKNEDFVKNISLKGFLIKAIYNSWDNSKMVDWKKKVEACIKENYGKTDDGTVLNEVMELLDIKI